MKSEREKLIGDVVRQLIAEDSPVLSEGEDAILHEVEDRLSVDPRFKAAVRQEVAAEFREGIVEDLLQMQREGIAKPLGDGRWGPADGNEGATS